MKRIALINPRYGLEASGSAEYYTRMIAEHLANRYEVEVLTTKAIDPTTWKDWYARDIEIIRGVTVRRFPVEQLRARNFASFCADYLQDLSAGHPSLTKERIWFEKQGPFSPACVHYIRKHRRDYNAFLFVGYDNYLTMAGLPEAGDRAILIPAAQEHPCFHFLSCESLFQMPRAFVFLTDEERKLVRQRFPRTEMIPCDVMGTGVDVPRQVDSHAFQRQYGLDSPYLLYVGKIDEKKDCPMMIRYFLEYQKRTESNLKLVLAGKELCRVPAHPDILPLGFISEEEKYQAIAGAKALLIPARQGRMPITLLESMTLSVPVLVNGTSDVLRNHCIRSNAGLYYRNYFEFEGAVQYLFQHPVAYMQLCNNAKAYITRFYDWNEIMRKFDGLIQRRR